MLMYCYELTIASIRDPLRVNHKLVSQDLKKVLYLLFLLYLFLLLPGGMRSNLGFYEY